MKKLRFRLIPVFTVFALVCLTAPMREVHP